MFTVNTISNAKIKSVLNLKILLFILVIWIPILVYYMYMKNNSTSIIHRFHTLIGIEHGNKQRILHLGLICDYQSANRSVTEKVCDLNSTYDNITRLSAGKEEEEGKASRDDAEQFLIAETRQSKNISGKVKYGVEINGKKHLVVYNRVPKCGSRTMVSLLIQLKQKGLIAGIIPTLPTQNKLSDQFQHDKRNRSEDEKLVLIQKAIKRMAKNVTSLPAVIHGHFRYLQVEQSKQPVYINIIRDPLARLVSTYYFLRFGDNQTTGEILKKINARIWPEHFNMTFDECVMKELKECMSPEKLSLQISYFCGINPSCKEPSEWSLEQAKKRVDKYLLVGINEEYESTVRMFERLAPDLFQGIVAAYTKPTKENKTAQTKSYKGPLPSNRVRAIMMKKLDMEYQFYNFVKNKFYLLKNQLGITS